GVPAQRAAERRESECLGRRKLKTGFGQMAARTLFEIVPALENFPRSCREDRLAPPIKLYAPCTSVPANARAQIGPRELGPARGGALKRVVDDGVNGFER